MHWRKTEAAAAKTWESQFVEVDEKNDVIVSEGQRCQHCLLLLHEDGICIDCPGDIARRDALAASRPEYQLAVAVGFSSDDNAAWMRPKAARKDRRARGFHAELCQQCRTGLAADEPKLFDPRCEGCNAKKRAGLRTGQESRPKFRGGEKWIDYTWRKLQRAAVAKAHAEMPSPRRATA
jgi:hypothetical protein